MENWKTKSPRVVNKILKSGEKKEIEDCHHPISRLTIKAIVIKTEGAWQKRQVLGTEWRAQKNIHTHRQRQLNGKDSLQQMEPNNGTLIRKNKQMKRIKTNFSHLSQNLNVKCKTS